MNKRQAKKLEKHLDVKETKNCLEELKQKVKEIEECQKADFPDAPQGSEEDA